MPVAVRLQPTASTAKLSPRRVATAEPVRSSRSRGLFYIAVTSVAGSSSLGAIAMRSICTSALLGFALLLSGCDRSGPPVRFMLPEGFRGVFQISVDRDHGSELVKSNGMLLVVVPADGKVVVQDDSFLIRWHSQTAVYPDGSMVSEAFDTNVVALRNVGYDLHHHSWMLVGTDREFRIATSLTTSTRAMPLARRLTDADLPSYDR